SARNASLHLLASFQLRMPNAYYLVLEANRHKLTLRVSLPAQEAKHSARCPGPGAPEGVQPPDSKERGFKKFLGRAVRDSSYGSGAEPLRRGLGQHIIASHQLEAGKMVMNCDWSKPSTSDLLRPADAHTD
ncbi:hypothetical protein HAX54_024206, partial [Datura stramonium]|nr:hypothetical protein [Datura stramonium]